MPVAFYVNNENVVNDVAWTMDNKFWCAKTEERNISNVTTTRVTIHRYLR
jgi:hypothetical protein